MSRSKIIVTIIYMSLIAVFNFYNEGVFICEYHIRHNVVVMCILLKNCFTPFLNEKTLIAVINCDLSFVNH